VTEQGILLSTHTQNKRVEKGIFLSSRERPESYIVAGHQVFLVVVVRPTGRRQAAAAAASGAGCCGLPAAFFNARIPQSQ